MSRNLIALFVFVLTSNIGYSQTFDRVKMDSLFHLIESKDKAMGSLSIFQDGVEVYQRSFGYADVEATIRATPATKYRIGSISKTYTAAIIMQMVDEGKLTLENMLGYYFPELPNAGRITMHHLLSHRSGLYNFTNAPDYSEWLSVTKSHQHLIDLFIKNGTVFEPGEKSEYSNTNYVLLSYIMEKLEGKSFAKILNERITAPLGLKNTYFGGVINPANQEAKSYTGGQAWKPATETDTSIPMGAGGIVSTATDLNIFYHHLMNGKIVSDGSLEKMMEITGRYGLGMFVFPFYERKAYGHTGGIDGFQSNTGYFIGDNVSVSLVTNGMGMVMNDIMLGVLSIYFDKSYNLPKFRDYLAVDATVLEKYAGTYGSSTFPLKITITVKDNTLYGQATGQSSFPLEAIDTASFVFEPAKLEMDFLPDESKLIFRQGPGRYELVRE